MKKVAILAMVLGILGTSIYVSSADAPTSPVDKPKAEKVVVPKEFISPEVPKDVQDIIDALGFAFEGETKMYYSGKVPGVNDYALRSFDTGQGAAWVMFTLALEKDEKGNVNPGGAVSEVVAYVFIDKKVSWYKSEEAKKVFEAAQAASKATK